MLELVNVITLAAIGFIDYKKFKIPNVIICIWIITNITLNLMVGTTQMKEMGYRLFISIIVAGTYIPMKRIVKCSAGDFKLFGAIIANSNLENGLIIIFISLIISLFPLASGVKKVQLGLTTFFGYIAFMLLK